MFSATTDQEVSKYGGFSSSIKPEEVEQLLNDAEELHNLDEKSWSFRSYKKQMGVSACRASYNREKNISRLRISVKAPLQHAMTAFMGPPFGKYSRVTPGGSGSPNFEIVEESSGKDTVISYSEGQSQTLCCCRCAARDLVTLQAVKVISPTVVVFGGKSIEHTSHRPQEGVYRMEIPMIAFYFEQEGDTTHVEAYVSEINMSGKIGRIKGPTITGNMTKQWIGIARSMSRVQNAPTPHLQAVLAAATAPDGYGNKF